jgi:Fic family protein
MNFNNNNFLDNTDIFSQEELIKLQILNKQVSLAQFLSNKSYIEKFGMDFIHTSAKIEGNTYDKHDTYTLLEYGRTAGGKKYNDAKMILNMKSAYDTFIREDLIVSKETLKDMHFILSDEMVASNERAAPRNTEVTIKASSYIPLATKEKLDDELNYMLKKHASIENPFNKALYIHCNLAYLQYFKDCNKRTARMMLNISLKNDNKMLYIPNEEKIKDYLVAIVEYYETGSYQKFKRYFMDAYTETIESILAVEERRVRELNLPLRGE